MRNLSTCYALSHHLRLRAYHHVHLHLGRSCSWPRVFHRAFTYILIQLVEIGTFICMGLGSTYVHIMLTCVEFVLLCHLRLCASRHVHLHFARGHPSLVQ